MSDLDDLTAMKGDELAALPEFDTLATLTGTTLGGGEAPSEADADRVLLSALLDALGRFDASALDPVTILHVHLSDAALSSRQGVVRVEELGPVVVSEVRDWLTHPVHPDQIRQQVRVQPVLDTAGTHWHGRDPELDQRWILEHEAAA